MMVIVVTESSHVQFGLTILRCLRCTRRFPLDEAFWLENTCFCRLYNYVVPCCPSLKTGISGSTLHVRYRQFCSSRRLPIEFAIICRLLMARKLLPRISMCLHLVLYQSGIITFIALRSSASVCKVFLQSFLIRFRES